MYAVHSMLINKPPDVGTMSSRHPMHQVSRRERRGERISQIDREMPEILGFEVFLSWRQGRSEG